MPEHGVETVRTAIAALNERDVDAYLACCTDDVRMSPPTAAIEGTYEGPAGVRRFFADVEDAIPDFRLEVEKLEAVGADRVIAFIRVAVSGRASGVGTAFESTTVYDLCDGRIERIRVFLNRAEALAAVRPEE